MKVVTSLDINELEVFARTKSGFIVSPIVVSFVLLVSEYQGGAMKPCKESLGLTHA
jgi:hypothetical protein